MARRLGWVGLTIAGAVALGVWLRPYALSIYHLEAGGRALDAALVPVFTNWLAPEQIIDAEELDAGVVHLQEAIRHDPGNVQAMRLLARVYLSQGNAEAALEVLERARAARPENPLLLLELGDVYDTLGQVEAAIGAYEDGGVGSRGALLAVNYLKLAETQVAVGSGNVAIDLWRKALAVDPGNLYALHRLARMHRDMGDEAHAAEYEAQLQRVAPQSVPIPPDFRLAEYQAQAMAALVDDGLWEHDTLLAVVASQVERASEGLPRLMVERELQTLLSLRPEDVDVHAYLAKLDPRGGD